MFDGKTLILHDFRCNHLKIIDLTTCKLDHYKIGYASKLLILPNGNVICFNEETGIATEYEFEYIAELRKTTKDALFKNVKDASNLPSDLVRLVAKYDNRDHGDLSPYEDPIPQPKIDLAVLADEIKKVTGCLTIDISTLIAEYEERALVTVSNNSSSLFSVKSNSGSDFNKNQVEEKNQSPKPV